MTPAPLAPPAAPFPSGFFKVLLVLAMVLGGYRALTGAVGLLTSALSTREGVTAQLMSSSKLSSLGQAAPADRRELEAAVGRVVEAQFALRPWGLALVVVQLPHSVLLIIAAVGTWRRQERKRRLLRTVALLGLPLQIALLGFTAYTLTQTSEAMSEYSRVLVGQMGGAGGQFAFTMMRATMMLGTVVAIGLAVVSLVYFALLAARVGRDDVRAHFTIA